MSEKQKQQTMTTRETNIDDERITIYNNDNNKLQEEILCNDKLL